MHAWCSNFMHANFPLAEIQCSFDESEFVNGHLAKFPLPEHRIGLVSHYKVGASIDLFCDHPDAEMDGVSRITCTNGGTWDHEMPICHQLPCSKLPKYQACQLMQAAPLRLNDFPLLSQNCAWKVGVSLEAAISELASFLKWR